MTSTDLRRTINAPTRTDFHLFPPKKLTTAVYKTKRSSTEWVHFINKLRDEEVFARMCARVRKRQENEVMHVPNSQSESRMNEPVF